MIPRSPVSVILSACVMTSLTKRTLCWLGLAVAGVIAGLTPRTHAQEQLWIRQFGTSTEDVARALAPDGAGGVIVAGWTDGSLGGPIAGGRDAFLARYDSAGDRLWIRQFGTSASDGVVALAPDGAGGVMVAGGTEGNLGGPNSGSADAFVGRYDSAGNQLWLRQFGTSGLDWAGALAPDEAGGVMVVGVTTGSLGGPNAGSWDAFLARYDGAGNRLWIRQFGTSTYDHPAALAPDGAGGVLVAGSTWGSLGGPTAGQNDAFLAHFDSFGNQTWIRQFGTSRHDIAIALAPDGAGGVMVAGWTYGSLGALNAGFGDAFLARFDSEGDRLWLSQFGTSADDRIRALAPDGAGGVMVAGWTGGSLGGPIRGRSDPFLARYDGVGNRLWIRQFGTSTTDSAHALAPDGAGGVLVAGYTTGSLGGPNAGVDDAFLARFSNPLGDLNCDGAFNGADIDPFFLALGDPAAYALRFPNCDVMRGDLNCDGQLSGADIDPFFSCLGGNCADCNANGIPDHCEVLDPLAISSQPQSTLACVGDTTMLSVETSSPPLTFQWRKNGNPIAGATSTQLRFSPVQLSDAGDYDVIVGDACVFLTSDIATLTVHDSPPVINTHPQSQNVCFGAPLVLSVDATGPGLTYRWFKDFTVIPGATERTYVVPAVSQSDGGVYVVRVANSCDTVLSDPASLTIQTTILTHPAGQTVCENDPVFFTVGAVGAALTYQWRKDGVHISGATQNFFVINAAALSDAGIYDVVVISATCTQTSDPAPLVVRQCP